MTVHDRLHPMDIRLEPLDAEPVVYRRRVIFECFKWDPQVGDSGTISDHACVISPATAAHLERLAEALATETMALESALLQRGDLFRRLGIDRQLGAALLRRRAGDQVRLMRFDFHPTDGGWALSEVNSDVPGGFAEASALPSLAAAHLPGTCPGRDTAAALVTALGQRLAPGSHLALVHATSYADDRQVMQFLSSRLTRGGFACSLAAPDHLRWAGRGAELLTLAQDRKVDGILRFFPAEWLPALPRAASWRNYCENGLLACNPVQAVLVQSKRCPLIWDRLGVAIPMWRSLLPDTRDPRDAPWQRDADWLLKPAFGRVGEGLAWRGGVPPRIWRKTSWAARLFPRHWIAQRRFASRPLASRNGDRHLCIGVFTVDGKAAGFYGRLSARTTIEKHAQDIAVLIQETVSCR